MVLTRFLVDVSESSRCDKRSYFSRLGNNSGFARGTHVENLIGEHNLTVNNRPGRPDTYSRLEMRSSNIDVTLSRGGGVYHSIQSWDVVARVTDSDHGLFRFLVWCGIVLLNLISNRRGATSKGRIGISFVGFWPKTFQTNLMSYRRIPIGHRWLSLALFRARWRPRRQSNR